MKPIDKEELKAIQTTIDKRLKRCATDSYYQDVDMNPAYVDLKRERANISIQYFNQAKEPIYWFSLYKKDTKAAAAAIERQTWGKPDSVPNFALVSEHLLKTLAATYEMDRVYTLAELNEVITPLRILKLESLGVL